MKFDLNIDNYTKDEIIQIFELPRNFDVNIVETKQSKMIDSIIHNTDIDKETQKKTINFIVKAKNIILNGLSNTKNSKETIEEVYNSNYYLKNIHLNESEEHMVQIKEKQPYVSSFNSNYFPGIINPLKKRTIQKNLTIDSRFRENYYSTLSTNYNVNLPININDVIEMQVNSIELPTTYYNISKNYGNNFFYITVDSSLTLITIPDGNYDSISLLYVINNNLTILGSPFNKVTFINNLSSNISGDSKTIVGFTTLSTSATLDLNFQADINGNPDYNTPLPLKLGWILGFRNGIYSNNVNYVSEGILNISGSNYLFLVVDDYNNSVNNNYYSAFNSSILNKNIIARISLQAGGFSLLQQNNLQLITTPREYFGPVNIKNLNIQLLDEYGRIVNLNNMDFSFCLKLTTVYDI